MRRTITTILAIILLTLTVASALVSCQNVTPDGGEESTTPADTSASDTSAADTTAAGISVPFNDNPEVSSRSITNATYTVEESTEKFELAPVLAGSFRDVVKYREGEQGFKGSAGIEIQPDASIRWFAVTSADWGEYTPEVLSKNYIALDARVPDMSQYDDEYFEKFALALVEVSTEYCDFSFDMISGMGANSYGERFPFINLTQTYPTDESVPRPEMYGRYFFAVGLYESYDGQNLRVSYTARQWEKKQTSDEDVKSAFPVMAGSFKDIIEYRNQFSKGGMINGVRFFIINSGDWGEYTVQDFRADHNGCRDVLARVAELGDRFFEDKVILLVDIRSPSLANKYDVSYREENGTPMVDIVQTYPTGSPGEFADCMIGADLFAFELSSAAAMYSVGFTFFAPQ